MEQSIVLARSGSVSAFRKLVERHQSGIRVFLAKYVHCSETAEDLAQEVFLTAYSQLDTFRQDSSFSTWLYGIARNKALAFLRAKSRRTRNEKEFAELQQILRKHEDGSCLAGLEIERQQLKALDSCLKELPENAFSIVEKYYFEGRSTAVISSELGQRDGAIRMRLSRIRKVIARCVTARTRLLKNG